MNNSLRNLAASLRHACRWSMLAALAATTVASSARAAIITWQAPQNATGNASDVVTTGTFVDSATAFTSDVPLNGVTFNHRTSGPTTNTFANGSAITIGNVLINQVGATTPAGWDANYKNLLTNNALGDIGTTMNLSLGGLSIGQQYLVQIWVPYSNVSVYLTKFVAGNDSGPLSVGNVPTPTSQYVIGNFTANAATQAISVLDDVNGNYVFFAAIQVRSSSRAVIHAVAQLRSVSVSASSK